MLVERFPGYSLDDVDGGPVDEHDGYDGGDEEGEEGGGYVEEVLEVVEDWGLVLVWVLGWMVGFGGFIAGRAS